jgi:hypothetical protein
VVQPIRVATFAVKQYTTLYRICQILKKDCLNALGIVRRAGYVVVGECQELAPCGCDCSI